MNEELIEKLASALTSEDDLNTLAQLKIEIENAHKQRDEAIANANRYKHEYVINRAYSTKTTDNVNMVGEAPKLTFEDFVSSKLTQN